MGSANLSRQHPQAYQAMVAFDRAAIAAASAAGLDPLLIELVKIRISQLNGCAFCLRMHTRDAVAKGETVDRLAVIAAWWESQYFTDIERSALALAEEVTELPVPQPRRWDTGVLNEEQVSAISWLAVVMNAWNRIAISSHYPVGPD